MSYASNRKWSRFGQKGGIGRAKGKVDKLAEPDSDELMFMEDEEVVVLALLRECSRADSSRCAPSHSPGGASRSRQLR